MPTANQVSVTGNVHATPILARLFGVGQIPVSATGAATMRDVEILMILDRSGSMAGAKMTALKNAATGFLQFFAATQNTDKMGLISFATTVSAPIDRPMGFDYVTPMTNAINAMTAVGATNHEDALDRARTAGGFTDQAGVPPADQLFAQFVVFFTDGMPTALREQFRYNGQNYDGVVYGVGSSGHANCMTSDYPYMSVNNTLTRPDGSGTYPGVNPATTGDGRSVGASACAGLNTKWNILEPLPVPGYAAEHCSIPMNRLLPHFCDLTRQLALRNAQTLKDRRHPDLRHRPGECRSARPELPDKPLQRSAIYIHRTDAGGACDGLQPDRKGDQAPACSIETESDAGIILDRGERTC